MNAETFLEQFETFAEAPNGVEQLRAMILQLAVQGKLVPQDPNDEPAIVLIGKMRSELKGTEVPYPSINTNIDASNAPFDVPQSWAWLKFGDFLDIQGGGQPPKSEFLAEPKEGYVRLLQIRDFGPSPVPTYIRSDSVSRFCSQNDVMLARYGASVGKIFMGQDGAYNVALTKVVFSQRHILNRFVYYLLLSPLFQVHLEDSSRSAQAGFNKGNLHPIPLPLPPLAEQKRIVAKVDQLLALCDELAARQQARRVARTLLVGATLDRLVSTRSPADLAPHVHRLRTHLDHLFDTPTTIPQLRQTILQLAVQGQLVPQDPGDENASDLLARIAIQKSKTRPQKILIETDSSTAIACLSPFAIPASWEWATIDDLQISAHTGIDRGKNGQSADGRYAYLKMNNITADGKCDLMTVTRIEATDGEVKKNRLRNGDFLFNTRNSAELVGKTCVFETESNDTFLFNNNILRIQFGDGITPRFANVWFCSSSGRMLLNERKSSTTNVAAIYQGKLMTLPFPVPPLSEQKRIVAKVTELMSLCDALESQLKTAESASTQLLSATVHHLLDGG